MGPSCPVPGTGADTIQMAHGGGGLAMNRLIETVFRPAFANAYLDQAHDGAVLDLAPRAAMTTDSYVVRPLFFPGGDIGRLAVNGTVNDLAMCGARPRYISAAFIIEEGLPLATLEQVVAAMADAARDAGVMVVTGDTKVVERGYADGLYINTAGVGDPVNTTEVLPASIRAGDAVILSGDIGRHGMAVMAAREDLGLESTIESDCAPVAAPVLALLEAGIGIHCLRDLTRGGLASALIEVAQTAGISIEGDEAAIPVREDVHALCELLGLDPLYVANEGRFIAFIPAPEADMALAILKQHDVSSGSRIIGAVGAGPPGQVTMRPALGAARVIDMLSGEQLPRIC
ncbi:MAG: hydrogenase expression/formation protein HypE [Alphaproteobacteria bacterium]